MCSILQVIIACGVHMHFRILKTKQSIPHTYQTSFEVPAVAQLSGCLDGVIITIFHLSPTNLHSAVSTPDISVNSPPPTTFFTLSAYSVLSLVPVLLLHLCTRPQPAGSLLKVKLVVLSANLRIISSRPCSETR
jgi:hypothetical protein